MGGRVCVELTYEECGREEQRLIWLAKHGGSGLERAATNPQGEESEQTRDGGHGEAA